MTGLRFLCGECGATVDIPNPLAAPPSEALREAVFGVDPEPFYDTGSNDIDLAGYREALVRVLASSDRDASPATPDAPALRALPLTDRTRVLGSTIEEVRWALAYADMNRPGWRAALASGDTEPGG